MSIVINIPDFAMKVRKSVHVVVWLSKDFSFKPIFLKHGNLQFFSVYTTIYKQKRIKHKTDFFHWLFIKMNIFYIDEETDLIDKEG